MSTSIRPDQLLQSIDEFWDQEILPTLIEYIKIPNVSVAFDPGWEANGHMQRARRLAVEWLHRHTVPGWTLHDLDIPGRTPLLLWHVRGIWTNGADLATGQAAEMEGWHEVSGRGRRCSGRQALWPRRCRRRLCTVAATPERLEGRKRPRVVILIEFSGGSPVTGP